MSGTRERVAVVGGGVAGIVASHLLQRCADVTLFERNRYLGGHTNTVVLERGPDVGLGVDTGFIVLNNKTYPLFHRFLADLSVPVRWSDMSFSYYSELTHEQYAGTTLNGLFADRRNLVRPRFYRFLAEIARVCRTASRALEQNGFGDRTLGAFLKDGRFSEDVITWYLLPMGAAIWSASREDIEGFPAESFFRFFANHGLLSLLNRPRWQTVVGGSHSYVKRFKERFTGKLELDAGVEGVSRTDGAAIIHRRGGVQERFDRVVIAAHADEALKLLVDPSEEEQRLLGAWRYQRNRTVLHTDTTVLPPLRRAWASWNYTQETGLNGDMPVSVSYHMNTLQGLKSPVDYCVTLNRLGPIREEKIIAEFDYMHPTFDRTAMATQSLLPSLNGKRATYFCGSYFGYGFHEDAVRAACGVAEQFGVSL